MQAGGWLPAPLRSSLARCCALGQSLRWRRCIVVYIPRRSWWARWHGGCWEGCRARVGRAAAALAAIAGMAAGTAKAAYTFSTTTCSLTAVMVCFSPLRSSFSTSWKEGITRMSRWSCCSQEHADNAGRQPGFRQGTAGDGTGQKEACRVRVQCRGWHECVQVHTATRVPSSRLPPPAH